ncbi:glycerol-3-phosphate ABC transporter permease [Salipiger aestuarii]|uniref:sn-glycerol-3-phosphate transport system permease protein UgpA n=1 Tax=Salipiger aestuarii TaxID=568098 RepID=A0A327XWC4_9RHOB|nr:ABC transporter permease subunit [Salipiger aestuarii]EIE49404.1 binding-protein-dependent transport systems inner membrane component [Citreicella sp. 357]KAA8607808.1 glycerol-3-phosphate ABC transporter permease [Salipiger aestuarii]KAA8607971.1 glycerol-3-phosphate ABC transporter permease [Salipiger aestuarii]KAB2541111.1 glycerol-3-phosphate ABC transporter permease [Salipiger aestuarii]RAK13308.1 sn-glycerol 3-phosphate transport system permease protein [Salipiger aestuarii]
MKRAAFDNRWLPILLLVPQLSIICLFFYWPAWAALRSSFFLQDPFGFGETFVGWANYTRLWGSAEYLKNAGFTVIFSLCVTLFSLSIALLLAVKADTVLRGAKTYRTLLMWVYAVAPPVAGFLALILFNQRWGPLVDFFAMFGWQMRVRLDYFDTGFVMIAAAVWKQIPVNFIFFLSGLQSIPRAVREAAMIDNASGFSRFWTVTFPLLAPTGFFLLIINITYALFDTFGLIDTILRNNPGDSPITLVYQVYLDGFRGQDIGGSSAQSVVLMVLVLALTIMQFRLVERRIHYT